MKSLSVFIVIIFCNVQNVTSFTLFDEVAVTLKSFANSFMSALQSIHTKVNSFIDRKFRKIPENQEMPDMEQTGSLYSYQQKARRAFKDIFEENTSASGVEVPELIHVRSEPTAIMTTPQLAKHHGKLIESHIVITGDGYLLTIHRLLRPLDEPHCEKLFSPTVLLHHGLLGSSADWILLGPNKSLPYILSNIGYDVWMTNARGNYYSRGHVTKNVHSLEYWKFSWQEMGEYDLRAVVDYIRKLKNSNDTMDFIGHSMGATALLVLLSTRPIYNKYFRLAIFLAPLAFMSNVEGPLRIFTPMALNLPEASLKLLGRGEFFPTRKMPSWLVNKYCKGPFIYCSNPLLFLSGSIPGTDAWDSNLLANVVYHLPAGGSTDTILHYAYMIGTGKFQKFDDKTEFPLKKVTLPIALISSSDDWLATLADVLKLYFSISNPIDHHIIRGNNFNHTDFVFGPEAESLIFNKVIEILERGLSTIAPNKHNEI